MPPKFSKSYEENAHMQHSMNERYLTELVEQFQRKFPDRDTTLSCLDIGCGGGGTTIQFYKKLQEAGYKNVQLTGLDISAAQIATAKEKLKQSPDANITFIEGNALELNESFKDSFDCVFSFFTFHWIDNKKMLSKKIAESLKENGLLFYLTVTALETWCAIRKELLQKLAEDQDWAPYFKDFDITPFAQYSVTKDAFEQDFEVLSSQFKEVTLDYSEIEFRTFISSWLPEIQQLRAKVPAEEQEAKIKLYLDKLLEIIPEETSSAVHKSSATNRFYFYQPYGTFFGSAVKTKSTEIECKLLLAG